ncbi:MAG TPA: phosphatidate cytidylyltransferase [Chitinophagaceae bacterium]|jgi:CDP-diglyceride synthetase
MAFHWQTFKTRTITAAVFVVIMLAGLLINHWTFFLLFSIIHFGCWMEFQKLVSLMDKDYSDISPLHKYGVMLAGFCLVLYFTNDAYHIFGLRLNELGWWLGLMFIFILPIVEILFAKQVQLKNIGYSLCGLLYISLSWGLLIDLRSFFMFFKGHQLLWDYGRIIPCVIIFSIWINDTMAYIVGSLIGKTPLSKISPKKTWEGTIGGIVLAVGIAALVAWWLKLEAVDIMMIAAIASITGTFGDLLESKLKRSAGVKDSGKLMPGHGGFLDRFDSLIFAVPFVWLYVMLVMR